ncbi:hypothetical protein PVK06_001863 [Gossypium arboreum]|uniref:Aminotransferase-like plant mobile domain-containing protein n=1 Tax=Gossypium arboreum TaxID=29729 RepID=A0ABR0R3H5_GOSAR|nr:hypothetical protein PVK06_001863 [Gossypium arboreum]
MARELIRLDNKRISIDQMTMSVDQVLQCYIRNMLGPPLSLIENYLREARFWHVATIGWGCKLDPKLINALIERWRLETHTFHLPCGECTITVEDVHLQLGLPVDGYAVTGSVSFTDWGVVCYELLDAILDNINGGVCRVGNIVQGNVRGDATKQSQNRRLPITTAVMGTVSLSIFTSSSGPLMYISTHNEDPWQAIFIVRRGEATTNSCPKGTTEPFKSKKKGRQRRPINSAHTITRSNSSTDDTHITAFSDYARLESMAGSSLFLITPSQSPIYRPLLHEGSHEVPSGSSSFYQSPSPYEIQTPPPWVMQTPPKSLFYQGGSPSQHPQPNLHRRNYNSHRKLIKGGI